MSRLQLVGGAEPLWISVLGPVRAWRGAVELKLGGPQQRMTLLALLLSEASQVSVDELVDAVWGTDPPRAAVRVIRTYIYRLRRVFDAEEPFISQLGNGYAIRRSPDVLDLAAFRERLARAETARQAEDFMAVRKHLTEGLAMWRGEPLGGISGSYVENRRVSLERLRLVAVESQLANELELGAYDEAAVRLAELVAENPLDERFRELLMSALYRSGRPAEALAVFEQGERLLDEELGLGPGPGLQALRERIVQSSLVPSQLPADLPTFVGRGSELARAAAFLPGEHESAAALVICVIAGMAGIGKTTLAVHWAHQVAHQYPDGQLYLDLRGFAAGGAVLDPSEGIRDLLLSLDVPAAVIPADPDARAAYYRSRLADRRVLILLDNARDADQVRPLLPGAPGCLVIVTSRNGLSSLVARDGARPLPLDLLPSYQAHDFLARRLGPDRLLAESAPTRAIIKHCAGLPLALAIVAARATADPGLPLAAIAAELEAGGGLDAFIGTNLDTRTVFSWSYHALSVGAARLFRLLTLHPGTNLTTAAAASLVGESLRTTRTTLAELCRANLLVERTPGRFGCHELLRAYATELCGEIDSPADREAALHRLLDHYLHSAHTATRLLYPWEAKIAIEPVVQGTVPIAIPDSAAALGWLIAEHAAVTALVARSSAALLHRQTWKLAWAISDFLQRRGHWAEQLTVQNLALSSALVLGDLAGQAHAHRSLGGALGRRRDFEAAIDHLEQSCRLFAKLEDLVNEARAHRVLAFVRGGQADYPRALHESETSLKLYREASDLPGQANSLGDLGWYLAQLGRYTEALEQCQRAHAIYERLDNRDGQANAWDSLGYVYHHLGDYQQAISCYEEAIRMFRLLGHRYDESNTLTHLAESQEAIGDMDGARVTWQHASGILEALGRPNAGDVRARLSTLAT
jgi:DNA-binding SARP family transcriptional activator